MVGVDYLAKLITKELNEIGEPTKTKFKIHASVGNYQKDIIDASNGMLQDYINGVIKRIDGEYISLAEIKDLFTQYSLEFAVKQEYKEEMEQILKVWVERQLGLIRKPADLDGISYLITPTPATVGTASDRGELGSMIPFSLTLSVQSIQNGLLSNAVEWKINGQRVERLSSSYSTTRTPNSKTPTNKNLMDTDIAYASNSIAMTIPYVIIETEPSVIPIVVQLEQDILLGNKDQVYTIERNNGINDIVQTFVLESGRINEENGKIIGLDLVFTYSEED